MNTLNRILVAGTAFAIGMTPLAEIPAHAEARNVDIEDVINDVVDDMGDYWDDRGVDEEPLSVVVLEDSNDSAKCVTHGKTEIRTIQNEADGIYCPGNRTIIINGNDILNFIRRVGGSERTEKVVTRFIGAHEYAHHAQNVSLGTKIFEERLRNPIKHEKLEWLASCFATLALRSELTDSRNQKALDAIIGGSDLPATAPNKYDAHPVSYALRKRAC